MSIKIQYIHHVLHPSVRQGQISHNRHVKGFVAIEDHLQPRIQGVVNDRQASRQENRAGENLVHSLHASEGKRSKIALDYQCHNQYYQLQQLPLQLPLPQ